MHSVVPRLSGTPGAIEHAGPALGEHNAEVYGRLGLTETEQAALKEAKVI